MLILSLIFSFCDNNIFSKDLYILKKKTKKEVDNKEKSNEVQEESIENRESIDNNIKDLDDSIFVEQPRDAKENIFKRTLQIFKDPVNF